MLDWAVLAAASLAAGFVDAIVGGGGLITVPALFAVYPQELPATLLGTNKASAVCGTSWAARQYARRVPLDGPMMVKAVGCALVGSALGAATVTVVSPDGLRRGLPLLMLGVLVYTLMRKDFGQQAALPTGESRHRTVGKACLIGLTLGFYDGFFGPGTGSFFTFLFVRCLGYDFLRATASAKVLNTATNAAALALFASTGHVLWGCAAVMAVANVAGSTLGARLALRQGVGFVRQVFIAVVFLLWVKTTWPLLT